MADGAKVPIVDAYTNSGTAPADRIAAGMSPNATDTKGNYVSAVEVTNGRVDITFDSRDGQTVLSVADTGRGIPPEELEHVFDRFHRGARDVPGTGLGLAIVQELAGSIGATVRVESTIAAGSRFELCFANPSGAPVTA